MSTNSGTPDRHGWGYRRVRSGTGNRPWSAFVRPSLGGAQKGSSCPLTWAFARTLRQNGPCRARLRRHEYAAAQRCAQVHDRTRLAAEVAWSTKEESFGRMLAGKAERLRFGTVSLLKRMEAPMPESRSEGPASHPECSRRLRADLARRVRVVFDSALRGVGYAAGTTGFAVLWVWWQSRN